MKDARRWTSGPFLSVTSLAPLQGAGEMQRAGKLEIVTELLPRPFWPDLLECDRPFASGPLFDPNIRHEQPIGHPLLECGPRVYFLHVAVATHSHGAPGALR
jgi:hypothetical protein